jgi:hypothetical protein
MPRIVDDDIFTPNTSGGEEKYPFDEWTDGKTRIFTHSEDFTITVMGFAGVVRAAMKRRGYKVKVKPLSETEVAIKVLRK